MFDVLAAARISDEVHADVFQHASHWMAAPKAVVGSKTRPLAQKSLKAIPTFHFPVAFPEVFLRQRSGFDVIVGNPPWEEATVEEDRFWTRHYPGFHSLMQSEQESAKKRLRRDGPDLVKVYEEELRKAELLRNVLTSGPFPGMGTGDPDVYKAFCWRFWNLVNREGGRIGVVLPRSAWAARGSHEFRLAVLEEGREEDLTQLLNNRNWVFVDVHPQYTITLTSLNRAARRDDETLPLRGPYASEERYVKEALKEPLRFSVTCTSAL